MSIFFFKNKFILLFSSLVFVSCSSIKTSKNTGKYYQNDGPGSLSGVDLDKIPNATPQIEVIRKANTKPYQALGKTYYPMSELKTYKERGNISWYGKQYHGQSTSSGEKYDMYQMSAASPILPLPSYVRVTNLENGKWVIVRVNDRGPFLHGRILDVSYVAAAKLGFINKGSTKAEVELIIP